MNFSELVEKTLYSPATLAHAVLYGTGSKRLLKAIADSGYTLDDSERPKIVELIVPKHKRNLAKPKPDSGQLEINIKNTPQGVGL